MKDRDGVKKPAPKEEPAGEKIHQGRIQALVTEMKKALAEPDIERTHLEKIKTGYLELTNEDKPAFFARVLEDIEIKPDDLNSLLDKLSGAKVDPVRWRQALVNLRSGLESPRMQLFRRFVSLRGGLKFLLDLRADILAAQRRQGMDLAPLDFDLVHIFESWFQDGFIFLKEISLDSPYSQIEIIKDGDMVHPMTSLEEMGQRLGRDRRCFALYHHAMPEEPVIFIEVALTKGIVRSIHDILAPADEDPERPRKRDTAIFYSINNTQNGLAGLGLGQVLIFQVVEFLRRDVPEIANFCTLSPMNGFWRNYLQPILKGGDASAFNVNLEDIENEFDKKTAELIEAEYLHQDGNEGASLAEMLQQIFSSRDWIKNKELADSLARPLKRLGFAYLTQKDARDGRPLDPVANFHLGNGATVSPGNVNFGANWSPAGVERSLSLMVNYVYSQDWRRQIQSSLARLGDLLPGLAHPLGGRGR